MFHWIAQSLVVVLPEIQETFNLSAVGVGGVLSIRELATGAVKLPGGLLDRTRGGDTGDGSWPGVSQSGLWERW